MATMRLGGLQIDPARNVIANGGASWSIEPRIMDLLVVMNAHTGEVLSREFLIDTVWKVEFGADESLTRAVSLLRKTFREAGHPGEIIETIPKRGYRLTVALTPQTEPAASIAPTAEPVRKPDPHPTETPPIPVTLPKAAAPAETPTPTPTTSKPASRRFALWGGVAAALAVAIVAAITLLPKGGPADTGQANQLIAFFGFTPTGDDPALKATAEATTDAVFEAMRSNWFDTVARTETRGVAEDRRFERAAEIGARYAMGGDARSNASGTTLSVRIEDVASRLTLWEGSFNSPAADIAYMPAQTAWKLGSVTWCIIKTREALMHETPELLSLVADRCREGGVTDRNSTYPISRMRAIVAADPTSAYNQAQLVNLLGLAVPFAPETSKAAWIAEGEAALKRAMELDPKETNIYYARLNLDSAKNVPAAEYDAFLLEAQANSEAKDNFALASANGTRAALLASSGRFTEALPHAVARAANKSVVQPGIVGMALAPVGRVSDARADLEPVLAAYGPQVWDLFIPFAFFLNAPDADAMLAAPPSTIPKPKLDCLRDIRAALVSTDARTRSAGAKRVQSCADTDIINWRVTLPALSALGDIDGAFRVADRLSFSLPSARSYETANLFYPQARALRADPRFLPLVEKLGMMDYWRATKSQPDVCGTEQAPFCAALKTNAQP